MTYLSRLIIDPRHPASRRDLSDCYQLHRTVLGAFPEVPDSASVRARFGLLYRLEPLERASQLLRLLVQSQVAPDWSHLPARYLGPDPDGRGNPAVRLVAEEFERISPGTRLIFRLRANPTRRLSDRAPGREDPLVGKRVALLREKEQLAWLARKGEQHGFRLLATTANPELPDARAAVLETARGRRPIAGSTASPMPLRFGAVLFEGRLEVSDSTRFREALEHGIGSGKAFGFGLLSVASTR